MKNLKNKKILLFAPELEKFEHRGIAFYTKSLINALFESGAEIWLVTSFNINDLNIKKYEKNSRNYIYNCEILKSFNDGIDFNLKQNFLIQFLQFKYKNKIFQKLINFIQILLGNNTFGKKNTHQIKFNYKEDNPYLKLEKLSFMRYISGFLSAPNIAFSSNYISFLPFRNKLKIKLDYFDIYITTEPLNLISLNNIPIFQTIHDLIPLEFDSHFLRSKSFYTKLKYCVNNKRIFISSVTKNKFNYLFNNKLTKGNISNTEKYETVLTQPPSLLFENFNSLNIYKNILNSIPLENKNSIKSNKRKKTRTKDKTLQSFNYFLFNASIDSRKNVFILVESFINSLAQKKGLYLVITGKLKDDEYSKELKKLISNNKGIILTGYVNESIKSALYINALSLLCPSIIEGFGIPVLDASCLGLNCYASDCNSHKEIQNLFDFNNYVKILPAKSLTKWSEIFYEENNFNKINIEKELNSRLKRYLKFKEIIKNDYRLKLTSLINYK